MATQIKPTPKARMMRAALLAIAFLTGCNVTPDKPAKPIEQVGRYHIVGVPGTTQAILLDTVTGQTWYRVSTGTSDKTDVTQWLSMDKTGLREWMEINGPRPDPPEDAHPPRP